MWALYLLIPAAFAADRLLRYKYGRRSKVALAGTAGVSFALSFGFVESQWPGLDLGTRLLLTAGGSLPLFLILAVVLVELWRLHKLGAFTAQARVLRAQLAEAEEAVQAAERRRHAIASRRREIDERHRGRLTELAELKARIAAWEEGGGLTRVRSIKLEEWRSEFARLTDDELAARRRELEGERARALAAGDDEAAGSIGARLDLIRALQLEAGLAAAKELAALDQAALELEQELAGRRAEAERLRRELEEWEKRRAQYVEAGMVLD